MKDQDYMNEARIKLAEAMNLDVEGIEIADSWGRESFDPFTDANDDYAVLMWFRDKYGDHEMPSQARSEWIGFTGLLTAAWHRKGDYAKAACKVLGIILEAV